MVTTTAPTTTTIASSSEAKFDFNYFANHHVERGRKHNESGKEMFKSHFNFDPNKPSPSLSSSNAPPPHSKPIKKSTTKLANDSPFNYSSNNNNNTSSNNTNTNCNNNRPMSSSSSSSSYWNNSQKVSDLLKESSNQNQPKQSHNPSRKPEKSNIVFAMEDKPNNSNNRKISQRTNSSINLNDNISSSSSSTPVNQVKMTPNPPIVKKIDQSEYGRTDYAQKPLWKARNKEFTTYKI